MIRALRFDISINSIKLRKNYFSNTVKKSRVEYLRYDNMELVYSSHETSSRLFLLNLFTLHYYLLPKKTPFGVFSLFVNVDNRFLFFAIRVASELDHRPENDDDLSGHAENEDHPKVKAEGVKGHVDAK